MNSGRYYRRLAAAFVRGKLGERPGLTLEELIQAGLQAGLRLHKFKRNTELPRVQKVLGVLHGLNPGSLVDMGSGRGTFLWPLLDAFPHMPVTAVDRDFSRVADIHAVHRGGIANLTAVWMDARQLGFQSGSRDVVTVLEVLEHLVHPEPAAAEAVRVARRFVIASVPSKEDNNPGHLQLLDKPRLEALLLRAGAQRVTIEYVLNHMIAVAKVGTS